MKVEIRKIESENRLKKGDFRGKISLSATSTNLQCFLFIILEKFILNNNWNTNPLWRASYSETKRLSTINKLSAGDAKNCQRYNDLTTKIHSAIVDVSNTQLLKKNRKTGFERWWIKNLHTGIIKCAKSPYNFHAALMPIFFTWSRAVLNYFVPVFRSKFLFISLIY